MGPKRGRYANLVPSSRGGNSQALQLYEKFLTPENEVRFQQIVGVKFNGERGFIIDKLQEYPEILEELERRKWLKLNGLIKKTNATIALEFYANAYGRNDYVSYVRGKMIDYSAEAINSLLELEAPVQCGVAKRRGDSVPSTEQWWEHLNFLCREGAWFSGGREGLPQRISTTQMKPIPKVWATFFNRTLESASNTSELIVPRIHGVLAILARDEIDVGRLISHSIKKLSRSGGTVYGHACIINALCERESVPKEGNDIPTNCIAAFTANIIRGLPTGPVEDQRPAEAAPVQMEPHQPQVPEIPPQYQCTPFELAVGEWLQDISHHLYARAPRFSEPIQRAIRDFGQQQSHLDVYHRFGSWEGLQNYIQQQRARATEREEYLQSEFRKQEKQYLEETAQAAHMFPGLFHPGGGSNGQ
ncbi:hypothetical protein L195_g042635 [Trifolium pratense]|uniref:Putative plant transposon protein domain-containing protein n=1 Tax=Trifolium pratense TaxID=57577 RepID=A0A2K3M6Y4_TRIPR|nr:hypothetical protein L195_g042635 [Trifolium pratense]